MNDLIGYGQGFNGFATGVDIIGANGGQMAPVGVPPYGYGFPAGTPFYPANGYGNGGVNPFAALALAQQAAQAQQNAMVPAGPDQMAGWGGGPGFGPAGLAAGWGCGAGPLQAPLAVQQNLDPLTGFAPWCRSRIETQYVGFEACEIDPCESVTITCSPCVLMKIIRFVIPSSCAFQLQVDQITVNGKEQLVNCGPVPAAMFVEDSTIPDTISTETIQPGCCVQIVLTNISNAPVKAQIGGIARVAVR